MRNNPRAPRYLVSAKIQEYYVNQGDGGYYFETRGNPYDEVFLSEEHPAVLIARSRTESAVECFVKKRDPRPMILVIYSVTEFYGSMPSELEKAFK